MYTPELADEILRRLSMGESLREICKTEGYPSAPCVRRWVVIDREGFAARYAESRDLGLEQIADEVMEIADHPTGDIIRDRLRFDARRWYLSKLAPKRYGDKQAIEHSVSEDTSLRILEARKRARGG